MHEAIRIRLRSDVPLGAFLSGGIDSSIVVHHIKELGYPLSTYTIGFKQKTFDETKNAASVAKHFNTLHHSKYIETSILDELESCLDSFDEPFADPSALPTWLLCQYATNKITVALSGDGVDELFAGYSRYRARNLSEYLSPLPKWLKIKLLGYFINNLPESTSYYGKSTIKKLKLLHAFIRKIEESPEDPLAQTFTLTERQRLFDYSLVETYRFNYIEKYNLNKVDPITAMMSTDQLTYLPEDILTKIDRMSMRHGLEVRSPFLDHRVIDFICRLPIEYKLRGNIQKFLLRKCYTDKLPRRVLTGQKHGFSVPIGDWFKSILKHPFQSTVFDHSHLMLNRNEILQLWKEHQTGRKDHSFKLWTIYTFCRWEINQPL
ncbi:asparagine synthetase B family protein [Methylobacter marinus]|uniref:asparagine synthetase B family protein n=1 Tax=Methylobacter marinus TaxID=34058 RepID=UPI0022B5A976|nr:asparagine synthase C-terminal domain-containing protein [Methylobacter marinus]